MLNQLQAKAAIVLFDSKVFDTADIAEVLGVKEAAVSRTLQASRDIVIEMHRERIVAEGAR